MKCLRKRDGRKLLFFGGGDGYCYAFDARPVKEGDSTYLKVAWKYDCNPPERKKFKYPAAEGVSEINASEPQSVLESGFC